MPSAKPRLKDDSAEITPHVNISVTIPFRTRERMLEASRANRRSFSNMVAVALDEWLERQQK